jgi:recombination protein RecA
MPEEKVKEEKILSLDDFTKYVKKTHGKDAAISATAKESYGDVIPCTSFSLMNALGIGGFAKRKIYTIDGDLSSGKSTTAYDIIGNAQRKYNDNALLIDKEDSYTTQYGEMLGIDNNKLTIVSPHTLEDMYDVLAKAIISNLFGVIVVDSVTAFAPSARFEDSVIMGMEARINSDKMRLISDAMSKSNTCLILIQQTREKIGAMAHTDPTTVSGGKAIPFYAHGRIRITRSKIDREQQQNIMKFTVIKNKMAAPFKVGTVVFKWNSGFDFFSEVAQLAVEFNIIPMEGRSYFPPETDIKLVGVRKLIDYLTDNQEYTKTVIEPLVKQQLENADLRSTEINENELY